MSTRRPGPTGDPTDDGDLLAAVLRAAAAPAHPGELAGEEAAVAAFRAAAEVETAPARPSAFRRVLTKVLTVKAAVAVAVVGSAGVVLAASGGVLPTPWSTVPPAEHGGPASTTAPAEPDPSARPGPRSAPAGPAVVDLCEAYAKSDGEHRAHPKFGPLIDAAGGADEVAEYCATHTPTSSKNSSKNSSRNEQGNGNQTKSPNTEKSGKNKPEKPSGGKPTAPPGETVTPGKNPPGGANTPTKPPANPPAKPSAKPESADRPGPPSDAGAPGRGRG